MSSDTIAPSPTRDVIPEKHLVFFSPHFDDVLFCLGGYLDWTKRHGFFASKKFHIHLLFSRSNYQARDEGGNQRTDRERVQFATGVRLIEDQNCLDDILGRDRYGYQLHGYEECFVRGKPFADSEMEFPHGMWDDFEEADHTIFQRVSQLILSYLPNEDTALVFPIAIKEHIDHFILREAAVQAVQNKTPRAALYFIEDKPYGGLATPEELERMEAFVEKHQLEARPFPYSSDQIVEPAFNHYVSQVEEVYRTGVVNRARTLGEKYFGPGREADCVYFYPP